MAELFDPAAYFIWPGTDGAAATDRATLLNRACSCGNHRFEVAVEVRVDRETGARREDVSLRCVACFKGKPARILGHVDVRTLEATEA